MSIVREPTSVQHVVVKLDKQPRCETLMGKCHGQEYRFAVWTFAPEGFTIFVARSGGVYIAYGLTPQQENLLAKKGIDRPGLLLTQPERDALNLPAGKALLDALAH